MLVGGGRAGGGLGINGAAISGTRPLNESESSFCAPTTDRTDKTTAVAGPSVSANSSAHPLPNPTPGEKMGEGGDGSRGNCVEESVLRSSMLVLRVIKKI